MNHTHDRQIYYNDLGEAFTLCRDGNAWCWENKYGITYGCYFTKRECREDLEKAHGKIITKQAYLKLRWRNKYNAMMMDRRAEEL